MGTRLPSVDEARQELADSPTVSIYAASVLLGHGEFSVRRAVEEGELPSIRFGRNIRVPSAAVAKLLSMESA